MVRKQAVVCVLEAWRIKDTKRRVQRQRKEKAAREKNRRDFEKDKEAIRAGKDRSWISCIARLYFHRIEHSLNAWIADNLGEENVPFVFEGLRAFLGRNDLPSIDEVLKAISDGNGFPWWYAAVLAGMDETYHDKVELCAFGDQILQVALAIDLILPLPYQRGQSAHHTERPWKRAALETRAELVRDVYLKIIRIKMARAEGHVDGLHDILHKDAFSVHLPAILEELLTNYPNAEAAPLKMLLESAVALPACRDKVIALARSVRDRVIIVEPECLWLAAGYIVAPEEFYPALLQRVDKAPKILWDLRDLARYDHGKPRKGAPVLSPIQLKQLAEISGKHFPNCGRPSGGWSGIHNAWNGAEFVHGLINQLSGSPNGEATQALKDSRAE